MKLNSTHLPLPKITSPSFSVAQLCCASGCWHFLGPFSRGSSLWCGSSSLARTGSWDGAGVVPLDVIHCWGRLWPHVENTATAWSRCPSSAPCLQLCVPALPLALGVFLLFAGYCRIEGNGNRDGNREHCRGLLHKNIYICHFQMFQGVSGGLGWTGNRSWLRREWGGQNSMGLTASSDPGCVFCALRQL